MKPNFHITKWIYESKIPPESSGLDPYSDKLSLSAVRSGAISDKNVHISKFLSGQRRVVLGNFAIKHL